MKVDYKKLCKTVKGTSVPKPLSGTLSGTRRRRAIRQTRLR
jgi:hypothetical protein